MGNSKEIKNNDTIKASFWYLISNIVLKGLNFVTIPIFSRMLTQTEFGYYNNFTAWLSILTMLATLSLSTSLIRARFDYEDDIDSYVTSNLVLGTLSVLLCFVVFWFNREFVEKIFALDFKYVLAMFLSIIFLPAYNMYTQLQRFAYKYKSVVAITLGVSFGSVFLSLLLMSGMKNTLDARIIGAQFPFFAVSIVLYLGFLVKSRQVKVKYWKYALGISLPYVVHLLAANVLGSVDRIMITNICGPEDTALYSMAYNIAMIVSVLWDSLNSAYSPWLAEQLHKCNYEGIKKYSYGYILFFVLCLIGVMLITPEFLYILGGETYIEAKYVIPPVMLGYLFMFLYSMYTNIEQFEKKTKGMAIATVSAAILNFGLNSIFIPRYGYLAAAYTTLVGYALLFLFHYLLVRRMGFHVVYNTKFIFLTIFAVTAISAVILMLYSFDLIRYMIFAAYVLAMIFWMYKNRKMLISFVKR